MSRLQEEFAKRERQMKGFSAFVYMLILLGSIVSLGLVFLGVTLMIIVAKSLGVL
tara:strand:- start:204 stop:368 length:165 start_codon:yes stop_codon:yes gene_type:complete